LNVFARPVLDLEVEAAKRLEKTKHVRFGWSSPGLVADADAKLVIPYHWI
jgi:hypothetical protein